MTYEAARQIFSNSIEAGQPRNSVIADLRNMGLTATQLWAVVNKSAKHFC